MKKRKSSVPIPDIGEAAIAPTDTPTQKSPKRRTTEKAAKSPKKGKQIISTDDDHPTQRPTKTDSAGKASIVASLSSSGCSDSEKIIIALELFSNPELPLPRKNRFISEWLCGALVKSIDRAAKEGDARPHEDLRYWELFAQVLERISSSGVNGWVVSDAPHIPPKLLISLVASSSSLSSSSEASSILLRCFRLLFREFGSIFRPSTDQFVAAAERLVGSDASAVSETTLPFLNAFLRVLLEHIQQQPNQRKVFASVVGKLLQPMTLMRYTIKQKQGDALDVQKTEFAALLDEIVARTLFHSSHMSEYPMAFTGTRSKTAQQPKEKEPAASESSAGYKGSSIVSYQKQLFETLRTMLQSSETSHHLAVFDLFPFLLDHFIQAYYSALSKQTTELKRTACFSFFHELFEMIHLRAKLQATPVAKKNKKKSSVDAVLLEALHSVTRMFKTLRTYDIITAGRETDRQQLTLLKETTSVLAAYVEQEETPSCFSEVFWCLSQLLQLSYAAVEPKLESLLLSLWRHWRPEAHSIAPERDFQLHLLTTYSKLRQIDTLLGVICACVGKNQSSESPAFAVLLHHWTNAVVMKMPAAQVSTLWELLLKEFSERYSPKDHTSALEQLVMLVHATLAGLLLEGSIQPLAALAQQTLTKMLKPLIKSLRKKLFSDKISDLLGATVLQLYHAALHVTYKTRVLLKEDAETDGVVSMTFRPVNKKLTLEKLTAAGAEATESHPKTVYAVSELIVARVAAIRRSPSEEGAEEAKTLVAALFTHAFGSKEKTEDKESVWNGQLLSVSSENLRNIALPHLISRHLPLLCEVLPSTEAKPFLCALIRSVGQLQSSPTVSASHVTRSSVFASIISSASFYELPSLRECMGRVVLDLLRDAASDIAGDKKHPAVLKLKELSSAEEVDKKSSLPSTMKPLVVAEDQTRLFTAPLVVAAAFPPNYLLASDSQRLAFAILVLLQCVQASSDSVIEALHRLLSSLVHFHKLQLSRVLDSDLLITLLSTKPSPTASLYLGQLEENYLRDLLVHHSAETKKHLMNLWQFALRSRESSSASATPSKRKARQPESTSPQLQYVNAIIRVLMEILTKLSPELLSVATEIVQQYDTTILAPLLHKDSAISSQASAELTEGFGFVLQFASLQATSARLQDVSWQPQTLQWIGHATALVTSQLAIEPLAAHASGALHLVRCLALIVQSIPLFLPPVSAAQSACILALLHHLMAKWSDMADVQTELVKIYTQFITDSSHQRLLQALQLIKQELLLREGNWTVRARVSIRCAKIVLLHARGWRAQLVNKQLHVLLSKLITEASHVVSSRCPDAADILVLSFELLTQVVALERLFSLGNLVSLCLLCVSSVPHDLLGANNALFMSVYHMLMGLLWYRMEELQRCMPAFLGATQALLSGLAEAKVDAQAKSFAENLARLFEHLSQHPQQFRRYSAYLLSDYIHLLQSGSLVTEVKAAIQKGAFAVLNICTEFEHAQLYRVLDANGKMLFKALHSEYLREYKFTGKV